MKLTEKVILIIKNIPKGRVLSYGAIAVLAGNPRGARQVSRILHSSSRKYNLPWHRVVNAKGRIGFKEKYAYMEQRKLIESEGIVFSENDRIGKEYFWEIKSIDEID